MKPLRWLAPLLVLSACAQGVTEPGGCIPAGYTGKITQMYFQESPIIFGQGFGKNMYRVTYLYLKDGATQRCQEYIPEHVADDLGLDVGGQVEGWGHIPEHMINPEASPY
jgi:hypothetical protein